MSAGLQRIAGRIPGERIATTTITSDSAGFDTTDVQLASVVVPAVDGRTYRVWYDTALQTSADDTAATLEIHEDTSSGTVIQIRHHPVPLSSATATSAVGGVDFRAASTANKTFVLTGRRQTGAGTLNVNAGGNFPSYLNVDYVSG